MSQFFPYSRSHTRIIVIWSYLCHVVIIISRLPFYGLV